MSTTRPASQEPRETCLRCRRPVEHCWCALVPHLDTRLRVVFLQHPRERDVAIGTARMAHLGLKASSWIEGIRLDDHPSLASLFAPDAGAAVLFPGDDARPLEQWLSTPPRTLVVLDGTWWQAKKLLKLNPRLAALPRLSYRPPAPGNYRIRKEPDDESLATVEAVAAVVGALEGDPARFMALLAPFNWMVERQLAAAATNIQANPGARRRRERPAATSPLPELLPLLEQPGRAVIVYAEANSHPRDDRAPGAPEVLHLVASRPALARRFAAVLKPRRPLGPDTARHLELSAATLEAGDDVAGVMERFHAFLEEHGTGAQLVLWGPYARDLLMREGEPARGFIDLRALAARALGRSPGGVEKAAQALGLTTSGVVDVQGAGRAGRMLALQEAIYAALLQRAAPPPGARPTS